MTRANTSYQESRLAVTGCTSTWYIQLFGQCDFTLITLFRHKPMSDVKIDRFLNKGNFARFASMSFPQADEERFATAYEFYLWAFLVSIFSLRRDVLSASVDG
jgi:hypothetical protein